MFPVTSDRTVIRVLSQQGEGQRSWVLPIMHSSSHWVHPEVFINQPVVDDVKQLVNSCRWSLYWSPLCSRWCPLRPPCSREEPPSWPVLWWPWGCMSTDLLSTCCPSSSPLCAKAGTDPPPRAADVEPVSTVGLLLLSPTTTSCCLWSSYRFPCFLRSAANFKWAFQLHVCQLAACCLLIKAPRFELSLLYQRRNTCLDAGWLMSKQSLTQHEDGSPASQKASSFITGWIGSFHNKMWWKPADKLWSEGKHVWRIKLWNTSQPVTLSIKVCSQINDS